MTSPTASIASIVETVVSYASGATSSTGVVVAALPTPNGRLAIVLDTTACHPVDAAWPDQRADRGTLEIGGRSTPIVDCLVGATDGSEIFLGADMPAKKGAEGWTFFVAHIIAPDIFPDQPPVIGATATVTVDAGYRSAVSAGHTGCHLASLALNSALATAWTKDVQADAAGHPNFDALAIDTSTITEFASLDVYRLGKSLRRKGFPTAALVENLAAVEESINATLAAWVSSDAAIHIEHDGDLLTARRYWVCALPDGDVSIPCGGTHLNSLAEASAISVSLTAEEADGASIVRMHTVVTPA